MPSHLLAWAIAALVAVAIVVRPLRWPEAVWACAGALLVVALGLLPFAEAIAAIAKGSDVYLFLVGMLLLSELGRRGGLFDWLATFAVNHARGSPRRLFLLVFAVGTLVTIFLSNDATAVVLTPAVFAVARKAQARALPLLFACAFIANAASFVLPISNPANIVLYGGHPRRWVRGCCASRCHRCWRSWPPMPACAGPSGMRWSANAARRCRTRRSAAVPGSRWAGWPRPPPACWRCRRSTFRWGCRLRCWA